MVSIQKRSEEKPENMWDLSPIYLDAAAWDKDFLYWTSEKTLPPYWESISRQKTQLGAGPGECRSLLDEIVKIERGLVRLYTYAHLKHDEEITEREWKERYDRISTLLHTFEHEMAWLRPTLMALPDTTLEKYLSSPELALYHFYIQKIIRLKPHTLSIENEELLAYAGHAMQAPHRAFSALTDADLQFGEVTDSVDQKRPLSHAMYAVYIRSPDRLLRERAFRQYHTRYIEHENTLCELLNGVIQGHWFTARSRHYKSCLEAALFPKQLEVESYRSLIDAVHQGLPVLHRYFDLRRRVLGLDQLHLYDVYVPLVSQQEETVPYHKGEEVVIASVAPLGIDYQKKLSKGLREQKWVDRYENKNKRSGAYSSGCYDSHPYILMNYQQVLRDVFTLAHEAGHSMHSLYTREHQPYIYGDYPIFLAEVASTFNEELLSRLLISQSEDTLKKAFLINQKIEDIRGTLFRQTMFAEFEWMIHQWVEEGTPLTPERLKNAYRELNTRYFGPAVFIDPEIEIEWARIPHFYYNFYVFQYATGLSAALALCDRVYAQEEGAVDAYLSFLKSGSSDDPLPILKRAGVDMTSVEPVTRAIDRFDSLVKELESLLLP